MAARIDQWLWAARLFKTRSQATQACRGGRVLVAGDAVKASREVHRGDVIEIRLTPILRRFRVKQLAVKRVSAKLAVNLVEEITPPEDLEKLALIRRDPRHLLFAGRERGSGRPTKKERRQMEKWRDEDEPSEF